MALETLRGCPVDPCAHYTPSWSPADWVGHMYGGRYVCNKDSKRFFSKLLSWLCSRHLVRQVDRIVRHCKIRSKTPTTKILVFLPSETTKPVRGSLWWFRLTWLPSDCLTIAQQSGDHLTIAQITGVALTICSLPEGASWDITRQMIFVTLAMMRSLVQWRYCLHWSLDICCTQLTQLLRYGARLLSRNKGLC